MRTRSIRLWSISLWVFITLTLASSIREVSIIVVISVVGCTADISRQPPETARSPGGHRPDVAQRAEEVLAALDQVAQRRRLDDLQFLPRAALAHAARGIDFPRAPRGTDARSASCPRREPGIPAASPGRRRP